MRPAPAQTCRAAQAARGWSEMTESVSARSLCRPGGRGAQRIDQRAHFSRESTGAPGSPPGVTGVFGAQVVAVDATSGAVVGATIGEWSCTAPAPCNLTARMKSMVWR